MKQRNIKTSEKVQRPLDVPTSQNVIYSQQDAHSNHGGYYQPKQQLSEGGPVYQRSLHNLQKVSQTKQGHVNISEILKENRQHNGLLANNI